MIDRLMPLLLALALVPGVIQQACCCVTGSCRVEASACEIDADLPPCCQAEAGHPPCCQDDDPNQSPLDPCRCPGCPAEVSNETLATEPRLSDPEADLASDIIAYASWPSLEPPTAYARTPDVAPPHRPPPDRQALLCVWTI